MTTVRQLLDGKSPEVHAVAPDAAVIDAIRLMAEKGIGAVLVMDGPRLVGILSERDYARKIVLRDRSSRDTAVAEIMTSQVVTVSPGEQVEHCLQLVTDYRIRHLPVVEGAPRLLHYVASKGAVIAMTRSLARELGPDRIAVNAVAPGLTDVEATQSVPKERHALYVNGRAMPRAQQPDDVVGAVLYLLSDGAAFVTGQLLPVNGGFVLH